jgi:hypothetical protein
LKISKIYFKLDEMEIDKIRGYKSLLYEKWDIEKDNPFNQKKKIFNQNENEYLNVMDLENQN